MKKLLTALMLLAIAFSGNADRWLFISSGVNVRLKPTTKSPVMEKIYESDIFAILEDGNEWAKIAYENAIEGDQGYVCKKYCPFILNDTGIRIKELRTSTYSMAVPGFSGTLSFSPGQDNLINYHMVVKKGDNTLLDSKGDIYCNEESAYGVFIGQPYEYHGVSPVVYDANQGLLFFGHYVWKKN